MSFKMEEMAVPCSWCKVEAGEPCVNLKGEPYDDEVHNARKRAYEGRTL